MFACLVNAFSKIAALKPLGFIKKAMSEEDGKPSMSRYTAFLVTIATIGWVTFVVIHTGQLPDLTSASLFIASGHGGYVANKISDGIANRGTDAEPGAPNVSSV